MCDRGFLLTHSGGLVVCRPCLPSCAALKLVISGSGGSCVGAEPGGFGGIGMFGVCELGLLVAVGGDWFGLAGTVLLCIVC